MNTIAAEALDEIATRLEKAKNINKEAAAIIKEAVNKHGCVIFNGNNYSAEWVAEAKKRGIPNITSTVAALKAMVSQSAVHLFEKYKVLTEGELHSRYEIYLEQYAKHINIEAQASIHMVKRLFIPVFIQYTGHLANTIRELKSAAGNTTVQKAELAKVSAGLASTTKKLAVLESALKKARAIGPIEKKAEAYRDVVVKTMNDLRSDVDDLETILPADLWPVPTYAEMLFKF